jgi:hypothetical protein
MARGRIRIAEEVGAKKTFAWAIDWPGWARSGKTAEDAREALLAYVSRYAVVVRAARLEMPAIDGHLDIVDSVTGGGGTDFGVPSAITDGVSPPPRPSVWPRSSRHPGTCSIGSPPRCRHHCGRGREAAVATATG